MGAIHKAKDLSGPLVEVRIAARGTSAFSFNFLRQIDSRRDYICVDTFDGFPEEQLLMVSGSAMSRGKKDVFRQIPKPRSKVLNMHGAEDVKLIQGDIRKIDNARFPTSISTRLLDVDLEVPIYDGLMVALGWPRLETGGVIVGTTAMRVAALAIGRC